MTCPHCGADASAGQKFCPKCSRLVDSPLLKVKQQIDAAREEIRRDLNAARTVRFSPPPPAAECDTAAGAAISRQRPDARSSESAVATDVRAASLADARAHAAEGGGRARDDPALARTARSQKKKRDEGITRASTPTRRIASIRSRRRRRPRKRPRPRWPPGRSRSASSGRCRSRSSRCSTCLARSTMAYLAMQLTLTYREPRPQIIELSRILAGGTAFLFVITVFGMLKLHPYGRFFQRLLLLPVLLWFPFGTIYAIGTWSISARHGDVVLLGPLAAIAEHHGIGVVAHPREGRAGHRVPAVRVRVRACPRLHHVHHAHAADGDRGGGADVPAGVQRIDGDAGARRLALRIRRPWRLRLRRRAIRRASRCPRSGRCSGRRRCIRG